MCNAWFEPAAPQLPPWHLARSHTREIEDLRVRVLDLADVIASKEAAGRDKDRAMLPLLRRTLELKRS